MSILIPTAESSVLHHLGSLLHQVDCHRQCDMRRLCTPSRSLRTGFALDIDGVFLHGSTVLPGAKEAVQLLENSGTPYVFVTNGGGMTEVAKAQSLSDLLQADISEDMVLMSHTPFRKQIEIFADKRVLVIGSDACIDIAEHYGFKKAVSARELLQESPTAFKQISVPQLGQEREHQELVEAAFIIGDPFEWGLEIQILTDQMMPSDVGEKQRIPLFASNADILYNNEHDAPRYTQGAFVAAFRHLFEKITQQPMNVNFSGKPFAITYTMAKSMIEERARVLGSEPPQRFVGIGDSPMSDVLGANDFGWSSVLLQTGLWSPSRGQEVWEREGAENMKPTMIKRDILEAVEALIHDA